MLGFEWGVLGGAVPFYGSKGTGKRRVAAGRHCIFGGDQRIVRPEDRARRFPKDMSRFSLLLFAAPTGQSPWGGRGWNGPTGVVGWFIGEEVWVRKGR